MVYVVDFQFFFVTLQQKYKYLNCKYDNGKYFNECQAQRDGLHDADDGNGDICRACKTWTYTYVNTE